MNLDAAKNVLALLMEVKSTPETDTVKRRTFM